MPKAIGYVRVSTDKQVEEGISLDAQIAKIEAWASLNDYELVHVYSDEGISGSSLSKRDGMMQALSKVKKGMAFVCYSLSRISRDTVDTIQISRRIEHAGADLVSLSEKIDTTGASGKMIFNMLAVLNQFERDQTAERTKLAMQFKKSRNQAYSPTPYGYDRVDDTLVINIAEALTILRIRNLFESGKSYGAIARILNDSNIPTKLNKLWRSNTVFYLLKRSNVSSDSLES
ncbi:recombinase family protein [Acinetobacter chengduensis]|uniref:Recombinase family protein n=1 Tax=Acinetobacter chengduensis TaxID=2420890 RepID=A0ABX9TSP7_9GAMM|nr:recombinase family protein [Acinetobacter chengduensis]RLL19039.1 recombinase family protein [Acinetobacter chengduensis]